VGSEMCIRDRAADLIPNLTNIAVAPDRQAPAPQAPVLDLTDALELDPQEIMP